MTQPLPLVLARDPLIGQTVGGYLVEQVLGEGGMGLVYRARHPLLNRHFAVKVLRPELASDTTFSGNFVREAQTLSSLRHPAIIDIVDFGPLADGRQYMVMEFLEGRTLEAELVQGGRMFPDRALKLADEILDALSAAHSVDVIHRDLKPSNVFLAKVSGGREVVKLLDFGLAKQQPVVLEAHAAAVAGASVIAGTPEYIAPEQAQGHAASKQSDLYSFGVMLFEMLAGVLPFLPDDRLAGDERIRGLLLKHANQRAPALEDAAGGIHFPQELSELVADLLTKTPAERPSSADTVRKRLQKISRTFQQEATQQRANPLLAAPPSRAATTTEPVIRVGQTQKAIAAVGLGKKDTRRRSIVAVVILLLALLWWARSPETKPVEPVVVPAPVVVAPVAVLEPAVVAVEASPAPVRVDDELAVLSPTIPKVQRPPPGRPAAKYVPEARPWILMAPGCTPSASWREDAIRTLRELGEVAAESKAADGTPNKRKYQDWARREGAVRDAINAAGGQLECGQASQQLGELTDAVLKP